MSNYRQYGNFIRLRYSRLDCVRHVAPPIPLDIPRRRFDFDDFSRGVDFVVSLRQLYLECSNVEWDRNGNQWQIRHAMGRSGAVYWEWQPQWYVIVYNLYSGE